MAATEAAAAPAPVAVEEGRSKTVVLVAVDDSDHSYRALEWAVRHVANAGVPTELVVVHAKQAASSVVTVGGAGMYCTTTPSSILRRSVFQSGVLVLNWGFDNLWQLLPVT